MSDPIFGAGYIENKNAVIKMLVIFLNWLQMSDNNYSFSMKQSNNLLKRIIGSIKNTHITGND